MGAVLNEDEENATDGEQRDSVQEETTVVSATMGIKVENQYQCRLHPRSREKIVNNFR